MSSLKCAVIFDLDNTLIASDAIEPYRREGKWEKAYANMHLCHADVEMVKYVKSLMRQGIMVSVVSNAPYDYCQKMLAYMGLKIGYVIGYDDCIYHKPYSEPVDLVLSLLNHPDIAIGVGDSYKDADCYKNAGITAVNYCGITKKPITKQNVVNCSSIQGLKDTIAGIIKTEKEKAEHTAAAYPLEQMSFF